MEPPAPAGRPPDPAGQPGPAAQPGPGEEPDRPARPLLGSFLGMGGMACVLFLVLASGLVAPWYGVLLLCVIWIVLFVLGTRWFMTRPWRVAALPLVMLVVWYGTITVGAFLFGWNA